MKLASIPPTLTVLCTAFLAAPAAALAANGEKTPLDLGTPEKATEVAAGPGGGGLVRTIVGLAVVIGVIYGLYWVLKQVKSSREATATGQGLQTVATLPLGTNRSLHLVRAGDEVYLLAAGEGGMTQLRTYREPEARALGLLEDEVVEAKTPGNGKPLGKILDEIRRKTVIK
jgi:flagellar protein FliO/FliZ